MAQHDSQPPPTVRHAYSYSATNAALDELEDLAKAKTARMTNLQRTQFLAHIKPIIGRLAAEHDAAALRMLAEQWRREEAEATREPMPTLPITGESEPPTERRPSKWS